VRPIIHISFPVLDIEESVDFYRSKLGAKVGRQSDGAVDVLVFGAQLTLHDDPANVSDPMPRSRHFGATVAWSEWGEIADRFAASDALVEAATLAYVGEVKEQRKLMIADPSGNLIEIKSYRNPEAVLGITPAD
jgi:extradiol dioxygenase family protein